jgi:ubiquinone biosynthesis monooxygenase Coq7
MRAMSKAFFDSSSRISDVYRVNYAGEYGAIRIYQGQIKALGHDAEISEMLGSELEHFEFFKKDCMRLGIRPTPMNHAWHYFAFLLGYITAKVSRKYAMLCTEAVETVIENHYSEQIDFLRAALQREDFRDRSDIHELLEKIVKFRDDEVEHKNDGKHYGVQNRAVFTVISSLTKLAILISKI